MALMALAVVSAFVGVVAERSADSIHASLDVTDAVEGALSATVNPDFAGKKSLFADRQSDHASTHTQQMLQRIQDTVAHEGGFRIGSHAGSVLQQAENTSLGSQSSTQLRTRHPCGFGAESLEEVRSQIQSAKKTDLQNKLAIVIEGLADGERHRRATATWMRFFHKQGDFKTVLFLDTGYELSWFRIECGVGNLAVLESSKANILEVARLLGEGTDGSQSERFDSTVLVFVDHGVNQHLVLRGPEDGWIGRTEFQSQIVRPIHSVSGNFVAFISACYSSSIFSDHLYVRYEGILKIMRNFDPAFTNLETREEWPTDAIIEKMKSYLAREGLTPAHFFAFLQNLALSFEMLDEVDAGRYPAENIAFAAIDHFKQLIGEWMEQWKFDVFGEGFVMAVDLRMTSQAAALIRDKICGEKPPVLEKKPYPDLKCAHGELCTRQDLFCVPQAKPELLVKIMDTIGQRHQWNFLVPSTADKVGNSLAASLFFIWLDTYRHKQFYDWAREDGATSRDWLSDLSQELTRTKNRQYSSVAITSAGAIKPSMGCDGKFSGSIFQWKLQQALINTQVSDFTGLFGKIVESTNAEALGEEKPSGESVSIQSALTGKGLSWMRLLADFENTWPGGFGNGGDLKLDVVFPKRNIFRGDESAFDAPQIYLGAKFDVNQKILTVWNLVEEPTGVAFKVRCPPHNVGKKVFYVTGRLGLDRKLKTDCENYQRNGCNAVTLNVQSCPGDGTPAISALRRPAWTGMPAYVEQMKAIDNRLLDGFDAMKMDNPESRGRYEAYRWKEYAVQHMCFTETCAPLVDGNPVGALPAIGEGRLPKITAFAKVEDWLPFS